MYSRLQKTLFEDRYSVPLQQPSDLNGATGTMAVAVVAVVVAVVAVAEGAG